MLPREHRLRRGSDFARVRKQGRAWSHPLLVLTAAPNAEQVTRVGFSVSKRVGKSHVRNRVRRLLREAVRAHLSRVSPGFDVVIIAKPALVDQPFAAVEAAVRGQLRQARLLRAGAATGQGSR